MSDVDQQNQGSGLFWVGVLGAIAAMLFAGYWFGRDRTPLPPATTDIAGVQCLPIPDGFTYDAEQGQLVELASTAPVETDPVETPAPEANPEPEDENWQARFLAALPTLGFPWMGLDVDGETASLTGEAPTLAARQAGFEYGRDALLANEEADPRITDVRNRIRVADTSGQWLGPLRSSFEGLGFPWLDVDVNGQIATLTGTASSPEEKERAFEQGREALLANETAAAQINLVVDNISVEGGEAGLGAALSELAANSGEEGPGLEACRTAFVDTMEGRNIQFALNRSEINLDSSRLLDALSGVAILCTSRSGFDVEIGGHTDVRGSAQYNQDLSQGRADAVRDYLTGKGVEPRKLEAVGYGETQPLDTALTEEAHALNRRTEFLVLDPTQ